MTREEISKWLMNLKNDIGEMQHQPLWHYAEALDMAIEALERKRGEWKVLGASEPRRYGCSNCKILSWDTYNFCFNCGSDMRGAEDEI